MIGARLKQARLLAGMTQPQLADQIGKHGYRVSKQVISKYENGKSYPTARFLMLASTVLDVPTTYLTHQRSSEVQWLAFRCRARLSDTEKNRIMAYAGDIVELQVELRELLFPDAVSSLPSVWVETFEDAENAAEQLRRHWNVGDRPLDNLVQTAEDRGVIVVGWNNESELFDGLSGKCENHPVTVINTHFPSDRQRLTLAHEIGHLVMDVKEMPKKKEEDLAYRFAAALLVPADHAYHELGTKRHQLDWRELKSLKRKYGMSMAAWVRRAYDLDIINDSAYQSMFRYIKSHSWSKDEPGEYVGDEEPLQLKQMAHRAFAEGLVSPDSMTRIGIDVWEPDTKQSDSGHLTVYDLLAMPEDERNAVMERAFELAADEDFEIFEADEIYDDYDEEFDADSH